MISSSPESPSEYPDEKARDVALPGHEAWADRMEKAKAFLKQDRLTVSLFYKELEKAVQKRK